MPTATRQPAPAPDVRMGDVLRQLREQQGVSLRTLASRAGFSASFLSQLENGQVSPSIASLDRIAAELGVTLVDLFEATQQRQATVVRANARPGYTSSWSRARVESLVASSPRRALEAVSITLAPRGSSGRHAAGHSLDQFAFVVAGRLTLTLGDERLDLARGDSVVVPKGQPHRWQNDSTEQAQLLLVSARFGA